MPKELLELLIGHRIENCKLLMMERRITAEREPPLVTPLDFDEQFFIFRAEPVQQVRMNDHLYFVDFGIGTEHLMQCALQFDAHAHAALDPPAAAAIWARLVDG